MFPSVVAVRTRPNYEVECRTSGELGLFKSRPSPSRWSPDPSDSITVLEIPATQLIVAAKSGAEQRKKSESCATITSVNLSTSKIAVPQSTLKLPVERSHSVGDNVKSSNVKSSMNLTESQNKEAKTGPQTLDMIVGRTPSTYRREPSIGTDDNMSSSENVVSRPSYSEMNTNGKFNLNDFSVTGLQPPELSTVGHLGLSPRLKTRGSPTRRQTIGLTKLHRGETKSVERFPPLIDIQLNRHYQHHPQQQQLLSQQRQQSRNDDDSTSTQSKIQLVPMDTVSSPLQLSVCGRSSRHVTVAKATAVPTRDVVVGSITSKLTKDGWRMSDCLVITGGSRPEAIKTCSRVSDNEYTERDLLMNDLAHEQEIQCADVYDSDNEDNDDDDEDGEEGQKEGEDDNGTEIDEDDTGSRMPVLAVRIEITRSSQRRTVVATSDVSSAGCDVIEKHLPWKILSPDRTAGDVTDRRSARGSNDLAMSSASVAGEHCLSIAGRGKVVVVDDNAYDNYARRRHHQALPRVHTGPHQTSPNGHVPLTGTMNHRVQQNLTKRTFSK